MAIVSISEAARLAGVGRATMYRRIDDGTISTVQNHDGSRGIDTSEILRVFGCLQATTETSGGRHADTPRGQPETGANAPLLAADAGATDEVQALKHQNQLLLANLTAARKALDDAKDREARLLEREERLLSMVEQSQRLLTDKTKTPAPAAGQDGVILQLADRIEMLVNRIEAQDREKKRMADMAETYDPLMAELASDMLSLDDAPNDAAPGPATYAPVPPVAPQPPPVQSVQAAMPSQPAVPQRPAAATHAHPVPMFKRDETPLPTPAAAPEKKRRWWPFGR